MIRQATPHHTVLEGLDGRGRSKLLLLALMTELLRPEPNYRILEIGTGSGYQVAVAAELVSNVVVRAGDGYLGWPERGPFDGILVTAAAEHIPGRLVDQLKPGARMIIPVDDQSSLPISRCLAWTACSSSRRYRGWTLMRKSSLYPLEARTGSTQHSPRVPPCCSASPSAPISWAKALAQAGFGGA